MANRIAGNVLIIDSAMGNSLVIVDTQYKDYRVNAFAVWAVDSTASIMLTGANTATDIIFKSSGNPLLLENPKWFSFSQNQAIGDLKCPIVTAGTAFLYLV